jgi:hypothetical protein
MYQNLEVGRVLDHITVSRNGKPDCKFETEREFRAWLSNPKSTSQTI